MAIAPTEVERCRCSVNAKQVNERRSRRLPEGLLDQPFTAGLVAEHYSEARFSGLTKLYRREGYGTAQPGME